MSKPVTLRALSAAFSLSALLVAGCLSTPIKSPAQASADAAIAARVYAALEADPVFFFRHVDVRVDYGVVTLSGLVWTDAALVQAQRIARSVPGAIRVENQMELARLQLRGGAG